MKRFNPASRFENAVHEAVRLIRTTRDYAEIAVELAQLLSQGQIRFDPRLEDRARAGLTGTISLGPEALGDSSLSLAQTLVHEHFHLLQNPFEKTLSFWLGVLTQTPPMRRYERRAYLAALDFLEAAKTSHPPLSQEAQSEQRAVSQVFEINYGEKLL